MSNDTPELHYLADFARFRALLLLDCAKTQNELAQIKSLEQHITLEIFQNIPDSLAAIINKHYDVVITDFCDGESYAGETIEHFKQTSPTTALILLTNQTNHLTEIDCLNRGADYVIHKPFNAPLILARLKAIMRWQHLNTHSIVKIGPLEFNKETKSINRPNGPVIKLTEKEAQVLQFLLLHQGKVVSRTDLLHHVWEYHDATDTHTVETHIYRLRKKFGPALNGQSIIKTEKGGYRMLSIS